ncbi:DEAD/DEAH box helicase [Arenibacterium sp. CAU 1754]
MTILDPNAYREDLNRTLARFVATSSPINEIRAPKLAEQLREKVSRLTFVKGPYVETLPDFEKGRSLAQLHGEGLLDPRWIEFAQNEPSVWDRPLHAHQEEALLRDKNYLVATGTGSGKTESFLYPMINDILKEGDLERPGVRAILVYPLNALANDQLGRIAQLLFRDLGDPGITLGRYTGQVKSHSTREQEVTKLRETPSFQQTFGEDADVPLNWKLSRLEMRQSPPHILITNYAMLEHILLLPTNRPLLQNARLSRIVLDEIHTYTGAQAIEVAFLLRRLKAHLEIPDGQVRCIGTSASLNPKRKGELSDFAERLFGEPFAGERAVITSQRKLHPKLSKPASPSGLSFEDWARASDLASMVREVALTDSPMDIEGWNAEAEFLGLDALSLDQAQLSLGDALIERLSDFNEVHEIARRLEGGSIPLTRLAEDVFPDAGKGAISALVGLISIGVLAVSESAAVFPLLPARYHLISRAPDRTGVSLKANDSESLSQVIIGAEIDDEDRPVFELFVCRNCGEPYIEAWDGPTHLEASPGSGPRRLLRLVPGGKAVEEDDEDDTSTDDDTPHMIYFDPASGLPLEEEAAGAVALENVELHEDPDDGRRYMPRCVACHHRSSRFPEPITTVRPGDEALAAVAAQSILESMPSRDFGTTPPMGGRNLLVFSDNRQDAAFFAPFFERTSREQALRSAILRAVDANGEIDIDNLVSAVRNELRKDGLRLYRPGVLPELETGTNEMQRLKALIVAELTTLGRGRLGLEGFGLLGVNYDHLDRAVFAVEKHLPEKMKPFAEAYVRYLLKMIREHRAVSDQGSGMIDLVDESIWTRIAAQQTRCFTRDKNSRATTAINLIPAANRPNRFTALLKKMATATGEAIDDNQILDVLTAFWKVMEGPRSITARHGVGRGLKFGPGIKVVPGRDVHLNQCVKCGSRTQFDTAGVCQSMGCKGTLTEITAEDRADLFEQNHYVARYHEHPIMGIAREHTAAIAGEIRTSIEEDFKIGEVNLLSCTTTMEMGVDLGDLESVLCKNVPPSIASYQQRAGRAGRRAQVAPIVLTTSRSGRYDRAVFERFEEYLAEQPRVPYLSLDNAGFFQRHQLSMLLAKFLEHRLANYQRSGSPQLRDVFAASLTDDARVAFDEDFNSWLDNADEDVEAAAALGKRLPSAHADIALDAEGCRKELRKRVMQFADAVWGRWAIMQSGIDDLEEEREQLDSGDSAGFTRIGRYQEALRTQQRLYIGQFMIDQLSRRAVIPTYSFPVHSVSLEVLNAAGQTSDTSVLELDRDGAIGISEYAPGSEIVAGGRVWISDGISKRSKFTGDDAFIEKAQYRVCDVCRSPQITPQRVTPDDHCSQCGAQFSSTNRKRDFIKPHGFLTSVRDGQGRDPGASRIRSTVSEEALLLTEAPISSYVPTDVPGILTFHAPGSNRPDDQLGRIITVNKGRHGGGFAWCPSCEHAVPAMSAGPNNAWQQPMVLEAHTNPRTGRDCRYDPSFQVWPIDLAHVFETDVRAILFQGTPHDPNGDLITSTKIDRTLQEALRLGAAELLETDARDLRAIVQRLDGHLVIVLYDTVSGGAGYSTRLTQEDGFQSVDLLLAAREILNCENQDCVTSCTRCLNDYSNQRLWSEFERRPALAWIEAILLEAGVQLTQSWNK